MWAQQGNFRLDRLRRNNQNSNDNGAHLQGAPQDRVQTQNDKEM